MPDLNDFISQAASKFGIAPEQAQSGAGALLGALKSAVGDADFGELTDAMPDAEDALKAAPAEESGGLGGMLSQAAGALGGGGGQALDVAAALGKAGIPLDKLGSFAETFVNFLKDKLPKDLVQKLLAKAGDLTKLLG